MIITYNNTDFQYQSQVNGIDNKYVIDISNWLIVANQKRCYVFYNGNNFVYNYPVVTNQIKKIAIIVESPHKNEFDLAFNPIRPLNGSSGRRFDSKICDVLDILKNNTMLKFTTGFYEIKIFNPVRYQASCYHFFHNLIPNQNPVAQNNYTLDRKFTNFVWKILYNDQNGPREENNFTNDIMFYSPDYIINCCTGEYKNGHTLSSSKSKSDLKKIVRNSLYNCSSNHNLSWNNIYFEYYHPCKW